MAHNIDSMAYYRERPWHGLGTSIPERANALEMTRGRWLGLGSSDEANPKRWVRR
jgi:hypothetical protein